MQNALPCSFSRRSCIVQRIKIFLGAKLSHFIHPVSRECRRTHHQGGKRNTVHQFCSCILLSPLRISKPKRVFVLVFVFCSCHWGGGHKIAEAGRDLQRSSAPIPLLLKAGHLQLFAQDHVQNHNHR